VAPPGNPDSEEMRVLPVQRVARDRLGKWGLPAPGDVVQLGCKDPRVDLAAWVLPGGMDHRD